MKFKELCQYTLFRVLTSALIGGGMATISLCIYINTNPFIAIVGAILGYICGLFWLRYCRNIVDNDEDLRYK